MQIVRIENEWDQDLIIPHNGDTYVVAIGDSKIVPYEAAASLFGDPRARNEGKSKGRDELYTQIRAMWNFYLGFDTEASWEAEKRPKFKAFDVNSGEPIFFVIDDPQGLKSFNMSTVPSASTDQVVLAQALADLQAQVSNLTTALALTQNKSAEFTEPEVITATPAEAVVEPPIAAAVSELPKAVEKPVTVDGPRKAR